MWWRTEQRVREIVKGELALDAMRRERAAKSAELLKWCRDLNCKVHCDGYRYDNGPHIHVTFTCGCVLEWWKGHPTASMRPCSKGVHLYPPMPTNVHLEPKR